jgi:hypothetical protein
MGVLLSLGRDDHRVVEDFIASGAGEIAGIHVTASNRARHREVFDAAIDADIEVLIDLQTEKSVVPDGPLTTVPYLDHDVPFDVERLSKLAARSALVEAVADRQHALGASVVVPPHFYVSDEESLELWTDLNMLTASHIRDSVRIQPVIAGQLRFLASIEGRQQLIRGLRQVGSRSGELRLSPLGGGNDGPRKISHVFSLLDDLRASSIGARVAWIGGIGHSVFAIGLASDFVTGIGYRERFNFRSSVSSKTQKTGAEPLKPFGAQSGVYLPSAGVTVPRKSARALYDHRTLKGKLVCSLGRCADGHDGPARFPREHFVHSMAGFVETVNALPSAWRGQNEVDRLERAVGLVEFINDCAIDGVRLLPSRTLRCLLTSVRHRTPRVA